MLKILSLTAVILSSTFTAAFSETSTREIEAAVVPELKVVGVLGQSVNISCKSKDDYKLRSCRWERLVNFELNRYVININSHGISEAGSGNCTDCNYAVAGNLENGDCTMTIKNVTEFHADRWECLLIGTPVDHTWIGQLTVELIDNIGEPYFFNASDFNITYNETSSATQNITCCVANAAKIPVFFQLDLDNDTFSKYDLISKERDTTCATVAYKFIPPSNGKHLSCIIVHDHTLEHLKNTSVKINVKFGPQISTASPVQTLNTSDAYITTEFSANPKPQLVWFLTTDVENEDSYFAIKDNAKYAMTFVALKGDNYTATLKVKNVTENDFKLNFKLRISNSYGSKNVFFRIVSPSPGDESDAYWLMILIGIGAVILCLVFFTVLFVILAKRRTREYSPAVVHYTEQANRDSEIATINSVGRT